MTAEVLALVEQCPTARQVKDQLIHSLPSRVGKKKAQIITNALKTYEGIDTNMRLLDGIDDDDIQLITGFVEDAWLDGTEIDFRDFDQDSAGPIISVATIAAVIEKMIG